MIGELVGFGDCVLGCVVVVLILGVEVVVLVV